MMNSAHNPNRSLIRIFCLSLSGLLAVYAILGVTNLFQLESGNTAEQAAGVFRSTRGSPSPSPAEPRTRHPLASTPRRERTQLNEADVDTSLLEQKIRT